MSYETVLVEKKEKIAIMTIVRPPVNALNAVVIDELFHAFKEVQADEEVLGIILTGGGKAFVAGADIAELAKLDGFGAHSVALKGQELLSLIEGLGKPVIAAINGFALGGGCELAMACTFRIASEKAKLGQPEVKLGIIPGYGGTQRLARLVGKGRAMELILVGDPISATEAHRIGLVNQVVAPDELLTTAESVLGAITTRGPLALKLAMEAINHGIETTLEEGMRLEANLFGLAFFSEDAREGISAFLEKREANFKNK